MTKEEKSKQKSELVKTISKSYSRLSQLREYPQQELNLNFGHYPSLQKPKDNYPQEAGNPIIRFRCDQYISNEDQKGLSRILNKFFKDKYNKEISDLESSIDRDERLLKEYLNQ